MTASMEGRAQRVQGPLSMAFESHPQGPRPSLCPQGQQEAATYRGWQEPLWQGPPFLCLHVSIGTPSVCAVAGQPSPSSSRSRVLSIQTALSEPQNLRPGNVTTGKGCGEAQSSPVPKGKASLRQAWGMLAPKAGGPAFSAEAGRSRSSGRCIPLASRARGIAAESCLASTHRCFFVGTKVPWNQLTVWPKSPRDLLASERGG